MLANCLHHLTVPALFSLRMHSNNRVRRRHQQQNMKDQPENRAKHDQDHIENRGKRLTVQQQAQRRQQDGK